MLRLSHNECWPASWKLSQFYDELEIGDSRRDLGYSCQYQIRHQWSLRSIQKLVPPSGTILDVAGGGGNFTLPLAEMGYHVTWNDLRSELAGFVKMKYEFGEVEFAPGNIFDFAAKWAGRFDGILAAEIIEHVAHPDDFLVCLAGMLKPGGRLFLTTPNGGYFRNNHPRFSDCTDPSIFESSQFKPNADGHIFLLDRDECRMLAAKAGLEIERIEVMTNPLSCGHIKLGYLLPYLPAGAVRFLEAATERLPRALRGKINSQMAACLRKPR
jgi:2-polyprenyl-6-hydroxyphenyl methylase/3-demethylubiquinone-9 3-methyltransferase